MTLHHVMGDDYVVEGEEREGGASLENTSDDDKIYGAIASGQGSTTSHAKAVMTKIGAWWEYLSYGYEQWDTWRP